MTSPNKHQAGVPAREQAAFANNPFAKLARDTVSPAKPASVVRTPVASPEPRRPTSPVPRLAVRHEAVGRSGKVVTRISGVPAEARDTLAAKLGKSLGCVAEVDAGEVVLVGSLKERAYEWLQKIGDVRKLAEDKPAPAKPAQPAPPEPPALVATNASGTYRRNIRPGMRVAIVLKEDQDTWSECSETHR
jgi:translation initiation factor 1 (eIF-1/SUI1)